MIVPENFIDIEIDKLTNSIENRVTGEVFDTVVFQVITLPIKLLKKKDWLFDWKNEIQKPEREVFALSTVNNPAIVQGLISIETKPDHVLMHLIESASFNKGKAKQYLGVPANLVAHACNLSFEKGFEGFVTFYAKTALVKHYIETLQAEVLYSNYMIINSKAAIALIERYYKK